MNLKFQVRVQVFKFSGPLLDTLGWTESYNWSHLLGEHLDYFLFLLVSRTGTAGWTERWVKVPKCALGITFWPLKASITMLVKNNHAHVTTQKTLNKCIKINFSVWCMVWPWCCLFQDWLSVKILMKYICYLNIITY